MTGLALALALCGWARGQEASTATVSASTAAVEASTPTAPAAPEAPEAPAEPVIPKSRVVVHKESAEWEPVSVRLRPAAGGRTAFESQLRKSAGRYRGKKSPATAAARAYPAGEDRWLVISVYPASLRPERAHLEARFLIEAGYLEKVELATVRVVGGSWSAADDKEDSFTLRRKGVDFNEQMPGSAEMELSAMDPGPRGVNAGRVRRASFGGADLGGLGFVDFSWAVTGVQAEKTPGKDKPAAKPGPAKKR